MDMLNDSQLLNQYIEKGDEPSFREIVDRHIGLVHSTALRVLGGDQHLAQDTTQIVFNDLARKAKSLIEFTSVGGWLYRHTFCTASKMVRTERRRKAREELAVSMQNSTSDPKSLWKELSPLLDEAINELNAPDRDLLALRYLEQKDYRFVAATLKITEDAAQKRAGRALDKLRAIFQKRGVSVTTTTLASALAAGSMQSIPTGLAATVTTSALTTAAATAGSGLLTLTPTITITKLKLGLASAILAGGLATPMVLQQNKLEDLREQNRTLAEQNAGLQEETDRLARLEVDYQELERLRGEHLELLRLRGQLGVLRNELDALRANPAPAQRISDPTETAMEEAQEVAFHNLQDVGADTPHNAIETFLWAIREDRHERFSELLDYEAIQNRVFAEIRSSYPEVGLKEAENLASKLVAQMREKMNSPGVMTRNSVYDQVNSVRINDISYPHEDQDQALVQLAMILQDGRTETDSLKLRKSGDNWLLTPPEERTSFSLERKEGPSSP